MTRMTLRTPSRLHFGLLSWGGANRRQFGGVGLMIDDPGLMISIEPALEWQADGALGIRVLEVSARVTQRLVAQGFMVPPCRFSICNSPREHVGLGVGTQLGLGVVRLLCEHVGKPQTSAIELAELAGRGLRSGIGLHGFVSGGLIVDGGRGESSIAIPPLLAHLNFPEDWSILVVIPTFATGLHGSTEARAFAELPPFPQPLVDRLCRLVLLGLLPAVAQCDLTGFGEALEELQAGVGQGFAPVQGGIFARPELEDIAVWLRNQGLVGVGQSSWGPTLYGFAENSTQDQKELLARLADRFGLPPGSVFWTRASRAGAALQVDHP